MSVGPSRQPPAARPSRQPSPGAAVKKSRRALIGLLRLLPLSHPATAFLQVLFGSLADWTQGPQAVLGQQSAFNNEPNGFYIANIHVDRIENKGTSRLVQKAQRYVNSFEAYQECYTRVKTGVKLANFSEFSKLSCSG